MLGTEACAPSCHQVSRGQEKLLWVKWGRGDSIQEPQAQPRGTSPALTGRSMARTLRTKRQEHSPQKEVRSHMQKGGCLAKIVKTVLTEQSTHPSYRRKSCTPPELGKHSENEERQCTGAQAKIKQMLGGPDKGSKAVITNIPQQAIINSLETNKDIKSQLRSCMLLLSKKKCSIK